MIDSDDLKAARLNNAFGLRTEQPSPVYNYGPKIEPPNPMRDQLNGFASMLKNAMAQHVAPMFAKPAVAQQPVTFSSYGLPEPHAPGAGHGVSAVVLRDMRHAAARHAAGLPVPQKLSAPYVEPIELAAPSLFIQPRR